MSNLFENAILPAIANGAGPMLKDFLPKLADELVTGVDTVANTAMGDLHDEIQKGIAWLDSHL